MSGICRLCGKEKKLCSSHILPHAFTRRIKKSAPQLVMLTMTDNPKLMRSNGEFKQYLLCEDCEFLIKINYEDYGTVYLSEKKNYIDDEKSIKFKKFDYKKYYLFILSILWRASVSSIGIYKSANELKEMEKYLRHCIIRNTLFFTNKGPKIDDFIKIEIFKIIDSKKELSQDVIDGIILFLNFKRGRSVDEGVFYYMFFDGYLIVIRLAQGVLNFRLMNENYLKCLTVNKICFREIEPLFQAIKEIQNSNEKF